MRTTAFVNKSPTLRWPCKTSTAQGKVTAPSRSRWKASSLTTNTFCNCWKTPLNTLIVKTLKSSNLPRRRFSTEAKAFRRLSSQIREHVVVRLTVPKPAAEFKSAITTGSQPMLSELSSGSRSNSTVRWPKQPSHKFFTSWTQSGATLWELKLTLSNVDSQPKSRTFAVKSWLSKLSIRVSWCKRLPGRRSSSVSLKRN